MKSSYIISIQRVTSYTGKKLDNPEWQYAQYDNYAGSFSTGYPCFGSLEHAIKFNSVKEAEKWFEENKRYISSYYLGGKNYNLSSLGIRKMEIKFTTMENIKMI